MALNPNHTFEELGDVKCSIVEKNCTPDRVKFLKKLLEYNNFVVVVIKSPPPKAAKPAAPPAETVSSETSPPVDLAPPPDTFIVGVADLTFSPTNAVFNRELKTFENSVVTPAYWKQLETVTMPDEWYWKM